jgi:hypothetical protein
MDPPCRYMAVSDRGVVLDLRELEAEEVECVRSWLYRSREVAEIWLAGANPTVNEALLAIAEDIRSLIRVERVWIQGGGTSFVQRGSVSYLRQHMLMDQYRAGEVSVDCDSDSDPDAT